MYKTYVTVGTGYTTENLQELFYQPRGFELKNNRPAHFPIIPIIADDYEEGDQVCILVVRVDNEDTKSNMPLLKKEIESLGISADCVREILVEDRQDTEVGLKLLLRIMDEIPNDSLVKADITYGLKPVATMLLYAMNFVEEVKDVEVEGIYYGEMPRVKGAPVKERAALYDLTAYKLLGRVIDDIKELGEKDVTKTLRRILNL